MSSKISEQWIQEDDRIIVKKTHDADILFEDVEYAKVAMGDQRGAESKLVGFIDPAFMFAEAKRRGIQPHDTDAIKEMVKKMMMDGEFSKLRVWEGTY